MFPNVGRTQTLFISHRRAIWAYNESMSFRIKNFYTINTKKSKQCARVLLSKGTLTLEEFLNFTKTEENLSEEDSKKGLSVLLHHRIIKIKLPVPDDKQHLDPQQFLKNLAVLLPQTDVTYTLKVERSLLRLRFPYFIELASQLGAGEATVLELICLQGQISLQDLEGFYIAKEGDNDGNIFNQYFSNLFHVKKIISKIFSFFDFFLIFF